MIGDDKIRAYESILEVINDRTETKGKTQNTIDYYEAVRIAYMNGNTCENTFDTTRVLRNNKENKALWEFTYRILNEEKKLIKVVNRDPDNLLVHGFLVE